MSAAPLSPPAPSARSAPRPAAPAVRRVLHVRGVVQGVGFRPFVYSLAVGSGLRGTVCNTSGGVVIDVEGPASDLDMFESALLTNAPALAHIDSVLREQAPPTDVEGFHIVESRVLPGEYQPISPDAATCDACLAELFNASDRRHAYPFINCTNCGPRFTIIEDVPYDRASTTMRAFSMCAACQAEYDDPANRRFHAQPNACPACGPRLWWADAGGTARDGDALRQAADLIRAGGIVALKALGGMQLACDAADGSAVQRLRDRRRRPAKPFAVMCADADAAQALCRLSDAERLVLESPARPVVLLRARSGAVAAGVAPGLGELGVMLPSAPLHHLLLRATGGVLVMTSGNRSEEPIAKDNDEAVRRLAGIADGFLLHDRGIHARYDDSVVRVAAGTRRTLRRARGLCPLPLRGLPDAPPVLALGAHLKNTFCLLRDGTAFVGPHIGDLDDPLSLQHHAEALRTHLRLCRMQEPAVVAADLHPDYASTRLAEEWWDRGARPVRVQHHHAHVASVMAEHGLRGTVLGVAFDGAGLGLDGSVWGGEFLLCDERTFRRVGHIRAVSQPGGDAAAREGWRMAVAYLLAAGGLPGVPPSWLGREVDERRWRLVGRVAAASAPRTTSAGRLFDAIASLLGVAQVSTFEGEAAMRLEAAASSCFAAVSDTLPVSAHGSPLVLDTVALVQRLYEARIAGRPAGELAATFHESLAQAVARACATLAAEHGVRRVALSGGVFQNSLLLERVCGHLRGLDLEPWTNHDVPANDGGISLGQALVAASLQRSAA